MKKQLKSYVFYMGIIIFAAGLVLKHLIPESDGAIQSLPFVMSGFGAGIIVVGAVNLIIKKVIKNNPEKTKQYEIEEKDERNIRLKEKSGYAAWHSTIFIFAILSLTFVILDNKIPFFLTFGALLVHIISLFVYVYIYNKKI